MLNISLYRASGIQLPVKLRQLRQLGLIRLFVTYLQALMLRHELFAYHSAIDANMTPQVCYLEKLLQLYISNKCLILTSDVILWIEGESGEKNLFINDREGLIFWDFDYSRVPFTVVIPIDCIHLKGSIIDLLEKYKLPTVQYTLNFNL
ncbi:MAG: hypothetical protein ACOYMF_04965 [Bacteroidales bacterium]